MRFHKSIVKYFHEGFEKDQIFDQNKLCTQLHISKPTGLRLIYHLIDTNTTQQVIVDKKDNRKRYKVL